jgi:hypothetical protein
MRSAAAAVLAVALSACVAHPVGPARTFAKYEGKATTTAEAALSAVQTARLVSHAASDKHLFGAYVGLTLGESEDAVAGVAGTFASIQPPNAQADGLRAELAALLGDAEDHLSALRIAARRGHIGDLGSLAQALNDDAAKLDAFIESHS